MYLLCSPKYIFEKFTIVPTNSPTTTALAVNCRSLVCASKKCCRCSAGVVSSGGDSTSLCASSVMVSISKEKEAVCGDEAEGEKGERIGEEGGDSIEHTEREPRETGDHLSIMAHQGPA